MQLSHWEKRFHIFAKPFAILLGILSVLLVVLNTTLGSVGVAIVGLVGLFCAWLLWSLRYAFEGWIRRYGAKFGLTAGVDGTDWNFGEGDAAVGSDTSSDLSALRADLGRLTRERDDALSKLEAARHSGTFALKSANDDGEPLEGERARLESELSDTRALSDELTLRVEAQDDEIRELNNKLSAFNSDDKADELARLSAQVSSLTGDRDSAIARASDFEMRLTSDQGSNKALLDEKDAQINNLQGELTAALDGQQQAKSAAGAVEKRVAADLDKMKAVAAEKDSRIGELEAALAATRKAADDAKVREAGLDEQRQQVEKQKAESEEAVRKVAADRDNAAAKAGEAEKRLAAEQERSKANVAEKDTRIGELEAALAAARQSEEALKADVRSGQDAKRRHAAELEKVQSELMKAKDDAEVALMEKEEVSEQQARDREQLLDELSAARALAQSAEAREKSLVEDQSRKAAELADLRAQLEKMRREDRSHEVEGLSKQLMRLAGDRDQAKARAADLESQFSAFAESTSRTNADGEQKLGLLRDELDSVQSSLNQAKSREVYLANEKTRFMNDLADMEQELTEARSQIETARSEAAAAKNEAVAKSKALADLEAELELAKSRGNLLAEERDRYQAQIEEARRELDAAKDRAHRSEMALEDARLRSKRLEDEKAEKETELQSLRDRLRETQALAERAVENEKRAREEQAKKAEKLSEMMGGDIVFGSLAGRYQIDYRDAKGQDAEREIAVYAIVERSGNLNLDSFSADQISCRTYRADRIQKLRDMDTGEVVTKDIPEWLKARNQAGTL